jgi:predicted DNA-binding protein with PD1-like motif
VRVEHDSDLIQFVTELVEREKIVVAALTAVGALKRARLGFYNQEKHEYEAIMVDSPNEIACCVGNISMKDGQPFVHAHAVLADKNGNTKAGHLLEGTVFAAEVHLRELKGAVLERKPDKLTGLSLWKTK